MDDSEIVDEIFRYFGVDQTLGFSTQSPRTTEFSKLWRASESAHTMGRADRATWAAMGSRWIMKLRHMTAEVVELEDVVIEENRHGEKIYHVYDSVKALKSYDSIVAHVARSRQKEKKHGVSIKLRSPRLCRLRQG